MTRPHQPAAALTSGDARGKSPRETERIGEPGSRLPPHLPPGSSPLPKALSFLPSPACRGTREAAAAGPAALPRPPPAQRQALARRQRPPGSPPATAATYVAAARTIPKPVARVPLGCTDLPCPRPGNSRRDPQRGRETGAGGRRRRRAPQPAARYPVSPPACRGDAAPARESGRGRAALPQGRATAAPREGREPAAARRSWAPHSSNGAARETKRCQAAGPALRLGLSLRWAGAREEPLRTRLLTRLRCYGCLG